MELLIILGLVLLNGIFSMSEMALVSARKFKLETARKKGSAGAKAALKLSENPNRFLSTVQIGITLIGILLGIYSGENLTGDVAAYFAQFELLRPFASNLAVGVVVVFITYLSIVLGELLPKRLGLRFPEPVAMFLAKPMQIISVITGPFVWLLTVSNDFLLRLLGVKSLTSNKVSEEEIKSIIRESADGGEIQDIEHSIVERVFELGDRRINTLMTHRSDLVFFDEQESLESILSIVSSAKHSAYPVCQGRDLDKMLGLVLLKDLFANIQQQPFDLTTHLRQPLFVTEGTYAYRLLETFKKEKIHYAIVVDEFGSTMGMVTMDDMLDALVGDMSELHHTEYQITPRDENSWFVDGQYSSSEFLKFFDLKADDVKEGDFVTVAGLFIALFDSLPNVGDKIQFYGYELEVLDKDGRRIDKVLVRKLE